MKKGRKYDRHEIEIISKSAIGKSLKDIMNTELVTLGKNENNKGSYGQLIEKYLFGMENNNSSEPDFIDAGIELKVTPYKKSKNNQLSAKERLVLNIIDYENEYKNEFETSHFWFKNNTIQILWYLADENIKNKEDYVITNELLFEIAKSEDYEQIKKDWEFIINKIKSGQAHDMSEADTMYLGACTKGANSNSTRKQPFNTIPAMQRAFCFKIPYMTQLVRKYIGDYSNVESIIKDKNSTFEDYINEVINKYKGKTINELKEIFNIESNAKNINDLILRRMFGISSNFSKIEEFEKANIKPKTIRVEKNGSIKESMSFHTFKFTEIINETWEDSTIRNEFESTKFMFCVFKDNGNDYEFKGIKLWNMPETVIETSLKDTWTKTINVIKSGNIVKEIKENGNRITNFPGMSENIHCHVRPHGNDKHDTYPLPFKDQLTNLTDYTKQCFWLNNNYIKEIISEFNN